jgi:acetylornithine deacetylase
MHTVEWLSRLIAIDTTSRNSNLQLIDIVEDWFKRHHVVSQITHDTKEKKANLFATIPAHDGNMSGGIVLSGHTDVVPVDGQEWDTNPFEAVQIQDRMVGRGTCDMKGFLAVILALVPEFQQHRLTKPIHFAFSYDEEVGCHGAPLMISAMQQMGIKPRACIVGEPTSMRPVVAHKGIQVFRCRVRGHAAHSSLTPRGCNAIEYAAKLICYIRDLADQIQQEGPLDEHFDVPFTSMSTNRIHGGIANNIIPALCEFFFEFRNLPQVNPKSIIDKIEDYVRDVLQPRMQQEGANASIEIDKIAAIPSFESSDAAAINQLARAISGELKIVKVGYATEAGLFQKADIPTIVCGPGSILQAHCPNEFVTMDQLNKCADFLRDIVKQFS